MSQGPTPDAILQLGTGFWASKTLLSAIELELFTELASSGPLDLRPVLEAGAEGGVAAFAAMTGTDPATYTREAPGMSAFALEDGVVYHTYSAFARGVDGLWGMYQWLDRAPKGRNETGPWFRRRDEYGKS